MRNPSGPGGSEFILSGNAKHIILVHPIGREYFVDLEEFECKIPNIIEEVKLIESFGTKVIGIGLNEENASFDELNKSKKQINELLGVPVFLPLSTGVDEIVRFIKDKIIK